MESRPALGVRVRGALARARRRQARKPVPRGPRLLSYLVVVFAGVMMAVSAHVSGGTDLRPARNADLADLVRSQARRNVELGSQVAQLRSHVDELSRAQASRTPSPQLQQAAAQAALTAVKGPGVTVTLDDAPLSVQPPGVDQDLLVVHQQDIQTVVNALWQGGAEAMTIQGQRITSLTGIKCVGNTVVLRGVPYAPPYVISAIGDPAKLHFALQADRDIAIYKEYVQAYHLGWKQQQAASITMPGYQGSVELTQASGVPR